MANKAYIIGNGPSLRRTNLNLIAGQPSYACNKIDLIYPKTIWRPTKYVHPESWAKDLDSILWHVNNNFQCYLSEFYLESVGQRENVHYLKHCHHHTYHYYDRGAPDEWHLPMLCMYGGAVSFMMQMAVLDGFTELYLLGCDLGYRDGKPSHFDKRYEHGEEQAADLANGDTLQGHVCARNSLERYLPHVRIFNAGVAGSLELYPRVRLEETL